MELTWPFLLAVCFVTGLLIILLLIPMPMLIYSKLLAVSRKFFYPLLGVLGITIVILTNEYREQKKYSQRKDIAMAAPTTHDMTYNTIERFKHQRNMYITILTCVLIIVFLGLIRVTSRLVDEIMTYRKKPVVSERDHPKDD